MAETAPHQVTDSADRVLPPKRKLSLVSLLWVYATIPATVVTAIVDTLVFDSQFRDSLRTLPEDYFLLAAIFGTPHIVASNLLLITNLDYLTYYWRRLVTISVGIVASLFLLGLFVPREVIIMIIVGWTVHHVLKQQLGIGNVASRLSGPLFRSWTWLGVVSGAGFYSAILLDIDGNQLRLVRQMVALGLVGIVTLTVPLFLQTQGLGRRWFLANSTMMVVSGLMFVGGYSLFAVLIPRLAHDATAFAFYINHDANRLSAGRVGFLHNLLGTMRPTFGYWPATLMLPVASLFLAAILKGHADQWVNLGLNSVLGLTITQPVSLGFVGFLALLHYSFESFTWKGTSPYRSFVSISSGR